MSTDESNKIIDERLKHAFLNSITDDKSTFSFSANAFFSKWFRKDGTPYFFLFHKNLFATNIQFAELLSLSRLHTSNTILDKPEQSLHFVVVRDFLNSMQKVVDDLAHSKPAKDDLCNVFMNLYGEVLHHMVLLDIFHGSCSLFFPPHMKLDLFKVCSEAGYIHSCGRSVYTRELVVADDQDFKQTLTSYIKNTSEGKKRLFVVYSHEDFTDFDRVFASTLRKGLDDVKIHVEKYSLGKTSLVKVLREVQEANKDEICLPGAGDYRKHPQIINDGQLLTGKTIWLIIDHAVTAQGQFSEEQFIICYDQFFVNRNPLQLFDENKPAWVAHTTIPHTLAAAMINITRPLWPKDNINIYDPFSGTGTTALEVIKFETVKMTCNDKSPIGALLLKDNLEFFSLSDNDLNVILEMLKSLSSTSCNEYMTVPISRQTPNPFQEAIELIDELHKNITQGEDQWFDIPESIVRKLEHVGLKNRLRFYLALRTEIRHVAAFERKSKLWIEAYCKEASTLANQVQEFCELRKESTITSLDGFNKISSTYSEGCTIDANVFNFGHCSSRLNILNVDAKLPPNQQFDLIITDPPYGFNNDIKTFELADLLTKTLDVLIASLKPQSQMVIALPDHSHSGKRIPLFATRVWVTEQIIAKAEKSGFEAVVSANIMPRVGNLFHPPYYWNSEKALKRMILHFQFRLKNDPANKGSL